MNTPIGGFCTVTGDVLTAAYRLWNESTWNWLLPEALNLLAGYRRDEFIAHGKVVDYTQRIR